MPDPTATPTSTDPDDAPDWLYLAEHFAALEALEDLLATPQVQALSADVQHVLVHAGTDVLGGWPVVGCGCRATDEQQARLW